MPTTSILRCILAVVFSLCPLLPARAGENAPAAEPKIDLRVIYFGYLDTTRAKDFTEFLQNHFNKVGQGELEAFQEKQAEGYDVVILDYGELKIVKDRIQMPKNMVGRQFSRPTVTIGATGAMVSGRLGLKTGYL